MMTNNRSSLVDRGTSAHRTHAFTFVELLVVLAVLALMVCLFATARAGSRPNIQGEVCLNNLRQMMAAFTKYTHDNSDLFPPNWDSTTCSWVSDNEAGWMPVGVAGNSSDPGNPDILKNPKLCVLTPYIRTNLALYRCPFDPRIIPYSGTDPKLIGLKLPAARSISLNAGVGTKGSCTGGNAPVDGPWLNGSHTHTANNPYATFGKWSDFKVTRPSDIWVFVDDDPWTINDAAMQVIAISPDAIDYPNIFNNNSTAFSFADGHGETHKWKSTVWVHNSPPSRSAFLNGAAAGLGYQDWFWWASHATRSTITGTVP
jgi:prepilin-type N-terminal cleavage/methylation domain-containing protein